MNKALIKEELIAQQSTIVKELQQSVDDYKAASDIDEDDTLDPEDFSHQSEMNELAPKLEVNLSQAEKNLDLLEKLDTSASSIAESGALIELGDLCLYVSIASRPFMHGGKKIHPISQAAPIFAGIRDKGVGTEVKIGEQKKKITAIH